MWAGGQGEWGAELDKGQETSELQVMEENGNVLRTDGAVITGVQIMGGGASSLHK